jgi:hypothetical protein
MQRAFHSTLGTSPFQIMTEQHPFNPLIKEKISNITLQKRKKDLATKDLTRRNSKRKVHKYKRSQEVLVNSINPGKLEDRWHGPYLILKARNTKGYVILETPSGATRFNIKRIKPFKRGVHVVS